MELKLYENETRKLTHRHAGLRGMISCRALTNRRRRAAKSGAAGDAGNRSTRGDRLGEVVASLSFQAGLIQYGGPLMLSAVVVLYLLFTPPVRAVLDRHYD